MKTKKVILTIIFLLSYILIFGQTKYDNFDKLILEANSLKEKENYKKAILKYEEALKILTPNVVTPFFQLAECAYKLGNIKLTNKWIRKGISEGGAKLDAYQSFIGLENIGNDDFYKKITQDYNLLRQQYYTTIKNIDIFLKVEELIARDQFVRKTNDYLLGRSDQYFQNIASGYQKAIRKKDTVLALEFRKKILEKPKEKHKQTILKLMQNVDSLNIARLMEITEDFGWQENALLILWHQRNTYGDNNYIWLYFKPIIDIEIAEGKISRSFWDKFDKYKKMIDEMNLNSIKIHDN